MINYEETKSQPISRMMVWQAYWKVKANKGSAGMDDMDWEHLDKNRSAELYKLWNRLTSGSYFPQAVKRVAIPKKGGGERYLGVPTILDRIAQEVVRTHLERIVEPLFHHSSFGYRPGRSCHQAVEQACSNTMNHDFAIDLDIKGFFDNIDHELLMKAVKHYCTDKWVLMYVERWLKAGIFQKDGVTVPTLQGTPQGGVISPLLANLFLHVVFDKWMEIHHSEKPFERYADDIVVHCKSEKQALFMLQQIKNRMSDCKLTLHPDKTKIINLRGKSVMQYPKGYDFLGFTIKPASFKFKEKIKAVPGIFVSQKSKNGIMDKFRTMNIHKWRTSLEHVAQRINPVIGGIINYYLKFQRNDMRDIWIQLNARLLKWVKWEKDLGKKKSLCYLQAKYKENPSLFEHWRLVHP
ncbi:MAG: group II intron reverse transcriptase/maturase [Prevotellaceae bacterium]|jgi:group II intron reverse transcriptase/maturase|nr:group II intron reverse transcriptase/maturase [Prevotellaceae bacterium]